jgi:type IV secretory pathway VirD2 relaxase
MKYSNNMESHRIQLEEHMVREGAGIDGSRAKLYGTDNNEYRNNMFSGNFHIFLCHQSDKIDLKNLVEKLIKKLEQQTGYSLYWQAANHYDTAHPHAHLLINGKDKNGKEITILWDIIKTIRCHAPFSV